MLLKWQLHHLLALAVLAKADGNSSLSLPGLWPLPYLSQRGQVLCLVMINFLSQEQWPSVTILASRNPD